MAAAVWLEWSSYGAGEAAERGECSADEFAEVNEHVTSRAELAALSVGEELCLGGGACPVVIVRRLR